MHPVSPNSRIAPEASTQLARAIREARGVEVFAIGDVEENRIVSVTVTCRGTKEQVNALVDRPRAGQVVIHNHPSGNLQPSDADMQLAGIYGENGVGFVIIDSAAQRSNWVVEPYIPRRAPVDRTALEAFFLKGLPAAMEGHEPRPAQLEMAHRVADALDEGKPLVIEAGTGTGKSLAYLVPAALWSLANDSKVVISTYTRSLQVQLQQSDLPLLEQGGITVRTAILQGRNNYVCKRRLAILQSDHDPQDAELVHAIAGWSDTTDEGVRTDLPVRVDAALWDRVLSDSDLTRSTRCPHYATCHYYQARRRAAAAHLVVVNHALLMADRSVVDFAGRGILPRYARIIVDEGHHLADAATSVTSARLTARAVRRAALPLLDTKRSGALSRLADKLDTAGLSSLSREALERLVEHSGVAHDILQALATSVRHLLAQIANRALPPDGSPLRITEAVEQSQLWSLGLRPDVAHLATELRAACDSLDAVLQVLDDVDVPEAAVQPLLDVRRSRRRLGQHAEVVESFRLPPDDGVRWIEPARSHRGDPTAALCAAPIDVAPTLKQIVWDPVPGTVATSATLSVAGSFSWWSRIHGLREPQTSLIPSPFDYAEQALLGLPRDLPPPDSPGYTERMSAVIAQAIEVSDGGAFVLCTSFQAVQTFARALRTSAPRRVVFAQGEAGRAILLNRFRDNPRSVLVGVDSFWEGVSVRGRGLRLVLIPRLPFRVPTDPLRQARHEREASMGRDPFLTTSLPEAVIKLRQGFGRLIRSRTDHGAVLILDRRLHDRRYGRVILKALPPARRVTGPWRRVLEALTQQFSQAHPAHAVEPPPASAD